MPHIVADKKIKYMPHIFGVVKSQFLAY